MNTPAQNDELKRIDPLRGQPDDIVVRLRRAAQEAEASEHLDYDPGFKEAADLIEALRRPSPSPDAGAMRKATIEECAKIVETECLWHGRLKLAARIRALHTESGE